MKKELQGLEEGSETDIHLESLWVTLKKVSNWKTPGHDGIDEFWFKKFTFLHDRLALQMSKCKEANISEWMSKGKTIMIQKDPPYQKIHSQQL